MGENSAIEWCDHTFNPWIGCQAISPACDHCYAAAWVNGRMGGNFAERRRTAAENWRKPLRWNRMAEAAGARHRVFCASLADVFDNQVPEEWRRDLWLMIRGTPHLDWLLLTKRPQNIAKMLPRGWEAGWPNVWLGTTAENQAEADRRIPHLLAVPARVRFLSCEPLLSSIDLEHFTSRPGSCATLESSHWVIAGGESGPKARPMHPDWARGLRDQCAAAGVPFFFKQWGEWRPISEGEADWYDPLYQPNRVAKAGEHQDALDEAFGRRCTVSQACIHHDGRATGIAEPGAWQAGTGAMLTFRVGKKAAGSTLDGREHREVPHG